MMVKFKIVYSNVLPQWLLWPCMKTIHQEIKNKGHDKCYSFRREWAQELDLFFKKGRAKNTRDIYVVFFSIFMRILISDKYVLVSPTEYGTFCVPYSTIGCAVFDRIYHTCDIFGPHCATGVTYSFRAIYGPTARSPADGEFHGSSLIQA